MKAMVDGVTYEGTEEEIRRIVESPPKSAGSCAYEPYVPYVAPMSPLQPWFEIRLEAKNPRRRGRNERD